MSDYLRLDSVLFIWPGRNFLFRNPATDDSTIMHYGINGIVRFKNDACVREYVFGYEKKKSGWGHPFWLIVNIMYNSIIGYTKFCREVNTCRVPFRVLVHPHVHVTYSYVGYITIWTSLHPWGVGQGFRQPAVLAVLITASFEYTLPERKKFFWCIFRFFFNISLFLFEQLG